MYYLTEKGVEKSIETWKIVVPLHDNDKKEFLEEVIKGVKTKITSELGGLTAINAVGQWQSGKQLFIDRNIQIIVDVPIKDHKRTTAFFLNLKDELREELKQHKIYVTFESGASELLSVNEFLQELGFEVSSDQPQPLTQDEVRRLIEQSDRIRERSGYYTLSLARNAELKNIVWEREILGTKLCTTVEDNYPSNTIILSADKLEDYFKEDTFGKPLVVVGDYEYQSFILDKERRRYIVGDPASFSKYDKGDLEPLYGPHAWHGTLRTSEFIPTYVEELLINYIILRELGTRRDRILMNVGSDGSAQSVGDLRLLCPAVIPDQDIQKAILDNFIKAKKMYESGTIDKIALMQAKVMNRYNEKGALIKGSRKLMSR